MYKKIWHKITKKVWYVIKPNQTKTIKILEDLDDIQRNTSAKHHNMTPKEWFKKYFDQWKSHRKMCIG